MSNRRGFLRNLAALPIAGAVPLSAAAFGADPWIKLGADHFRLRDAVELCRSDEEGDVAFEAWGNVETQMLATLPTTLLGALAGVRVALAEYKQFHVANMEDGPVDPGDRFMIKLLTASISVLEREVPHV